jgi:hypothetical protein
VLSTRRLCVPTRVRRGVAAALMAAAEPFARSCGPVKIGRLGYVREGVLRDEFNSLSLD